MDIVKALRSHGYKVTPQRLAVWDAIDGVPTHPTAEMIYQTVYPEYPNMSLATVYKALDIFAKIGLVKVLDVGDDSSHYDWNTKEHPHIRCIHCNRVDDLMQVNSRAIMKIAADSTDYQIRGQQISFEGICPTCQGLSRH